MNLVYVDEFGLLGSNYYWHHRRRLNIDETALIEQGLTNDRVQVDQAIISALQSADEKLSKQGYRLYIKDGYRSEGVYRLAFQSRSQQFGAEQTHRVMNMQDMPHAKGQTVDVALWDPVTNTEIEMRNKAHGTEAMFINFYKNKPDSISRRYQELQELVINTMLEVGFNLGKKREYFHFTFDR